MRHKQLLTVDNCLLLVVDIQEAFAPHIADLDDVIERTRVMIEAANLLEIPIVATQQYPRGLGQTVPAIREALGEQQYYDKLAFSCCQDQAIRDCLLATGRSQFLLVGIETHVCIAQTALDLLALGLKPYLAGDAISCRRPTDAATALARLQAAGVIVTTTEAAILEMTVSSDHPAFRKISKLLK